MFNIFVRHSQYNVSLPYLTKIRKAMRQLTTILKVSCKLKQATLNMFFFLWSFLKYQKLLINAKKVLHLQIFFYSCFYLFIFFQFFHQTSIRNMLFQIYKCLCPLFTFILVKNLSQQIHYVILKKSYISNALYKKVKHAK